MRPVTVIGMREAGGNRGATIDGTLTSVDSAVWRSTPPPKVPRVIEGKTRKLFEACRLRDVPIITFVSKLDREGRDSFDLTDEIEQSLALDVTSAC